MYSGYFSLVSSSKLLSVLASIDPKKLKEASTLLISLAKFAYLFAIDASVVSVSMLIPAKVPSLSARAWILEYSFKAS